jgi:hypothetical protein
MRVRLLTGALAVAVARLSAAIAEARSTWVEHVHGYRLLADDSFLAEGIDITPLVQAAAAGSSLVLLACTWRSLTSSTRRARVGLLLV